MEAKFWTPLRGEFGGRVEKERDAISGCGHQTGRSRLEYVMGTKYIPLSCFSSPAPSSALAASRGSDVRTTDAAIVRGRSAAVSSSSEMGAGGGVCISDGAEAMIMIGFLEGEEKRMEAE
jgi:hypothetical protein